jgi:5-methyltetrahydrofolate--homocysteine methyltransferase
MLLGTDITAALAILEGLEIDVIGLNCSTGPEHMRDPIRYLGENPAAGLMYPQCGITLECGWRGCLPNGARTIR